MKRTILILLLLMPCVVLADDDACELYLCLMGSSETDGGANCKTTISNYTEKFKSSCPNLPTCTGTMGPQTHGVVMSSVSGSGGSVDGKVLQGCAQVKNVCVIKLDAPALGKLGVAGANTATCGG